MSRANFSTYSNTDSPVLGEIGRSNVGVGGSVDFTGAAEIAGLTGIDDPASITLGFTAGLGFGLSVAKVTLVYYSPPGGNVSRKTFRSRRSLNI